MPWFPVDDTFHSHPKRLATSAAALGLWVVAGSWSNAHLTDGHIPVYVLPSLLPEADKLAEELVDTGLWKRARNGDYVFNDWLQWGSKRSAAEIRQLRADRAAAGRKGGIASGKTRSNRASKPEASAEASASQIVEPPALPSPSTSSGTGPYLTGRHARARDPNPYLQEREPTPADRPLAAALEAAGINGTKPARGDTVTAIAAQARQAITQEPS